MYKILPKPVLFAAIAWVVLGLIAVLPHANQLLSLDIKVTSAPYYAWIIFSTIVFKPVWRFFWKRISWLNNYFPDLNGQWDVELHSNWPRQEQVMHAANKIGDKFDIKQASDSELAPLLPIKLRAEINQNWWSIQMTLRNPAKNTPIDGSDSVLIEPRAADGLVAPMILYIYKQINSTDNVSDDSEFYGAAKLSYDKSLDKLDGVFWTARMWRRAMNTAGTITFTRSNSDV